MFQKISIIAALAVSISGASALAASVTCKVTGSETTITATGHGDTPPGLQETRRAGDKTELVVFTNVVATHSTEQGRMHLVSTGNQPGGNGTVRLDIHEVTAGNPAVLEGSFCEMNAAGQNAMSAVQCSGQE